ncbi:MAG: FadR/GntR family transcriptional regulator [Thermodesulfobacteriota bacterium]
MMTISRKKVADAVIEEIKRMMQSGELKEGQKLPNQNIFAAQLGVSRTSLREALNTLTRLGITEQRPGYGTVLRSRIPAIFVDHVNPPFISDKQATIELIEVRRFVEAGTAELSVKNIKSDQIKEMDSLIKEMHKSLNEDRIDDYIGLDLAFHYLIAKASHNRFLINIFITIRGFLEQYMRESFRVMPWMLARSLKFHQNIYQAIKNENISKAVWHMRRHILDVQRAIQRYYEHQEGKSGKQKK